MTTKDLHIGNLIELKVKEKGYTKTEFGRRINTSRQNVQSIFRRKSIDCFQLLEISEVLEFDFFQFFRMDKKQELFDNGNISEPAYFYGGSKKAKVSVLIEITDQDQENQNKENE